jgi:hypothetical protein
VSLRSAGAGESPKRFNGRSAVRVANPRDSESALAWQLERVGSLAWQGWSLKFQRLAFGYAQDTGWPDEDAALRWLCDHALVHSGEPPRGVLVWYRVGDATRVGCSLGSGELIGPLPDGVVGVAELVTLGPDYVWSEPHFPFAH